MEQDGRRDEPERKPRMPADDGGPGRAADAEYRERAKGPDVDRRDRTIFEEKRPPHRDDVPGRARRPEERAEHPEPHRDRERFVGHDSSPSCSAPSVTVAPSWGEEIPI